MNPGEKFCPNGACPLRGQKDQGNIVSHSRKEGRYRCKRCGRTFAATQGTPFYRLRKGEAVVTLVVTLLAFGCPPQHPQAGTRVAAFGFDERTVAAWQARAGEHCQRFHEAMVCQE